MTPKGIHIERIEPCLEFFYGVLEKIKTFYLRAILPEVIGKWYSKQKVTPCNNTNSSPAEEEHITEVWCYCNKPEETGKAMVGCDNPSCPIEWFHMSCLNMVQTVNSNLKILTHECMHHVLIEWYN